MTLAFLAGATCLGSAVASLFFNLKAPVYGYFTIIPALIVTGMMLGSIGLLLSSLIRQLENFADDASIMLGAEQRGRVTAKVVEDAGRSAFAEQAPLAPQFYRERMRAFGSQTAIDEKELGLAHGQSGRLMWPSSSKGQKGLKTTSQTWPSSSAK